MCRAQCVLALVAWYVGVSHCWDIAVSVGNQLIFYNTDGTKTDTIHFNSQNLAALAFDDVHNTMLYVDKQSDNDAICRYNLSSMEYTCLIGRNGRNIQGLAYDPATEKLFFTDINEKSINWISLKPGFKNNVYGNLLLKMDDGIPTDIAVDSCRGYLYWINTNLTKPVIERVQFDGLEREVVIDLTSLSINTTYRLEPHSLSIDPQTQNMYWIEPMSTYLHITYRADLNGKNKNRNSITTFPSYVKTFKNTSTVLTLSKNSLISRSWCTNAEIYAEPKINDVKTYEYTNLFKLQNQIPGGIIANYKIEQQVEGLQDCETLASLERDTSVTVSSMRIATEYDGPFCVNGMKVDGESRCKCERGYTGERCDVSECKNYCLQGTCSVNDEGLPICSCNAGYTGPRCEVYVCHGYCSNNGECSLKENSEPVCQCKGDYSGARCEVLDCLNYCVKGNCSFNDEGHPTCSCDAGYSGERCEVSTCHGYCLNDGVCSLNEEDEAVCECVGDHEGSRCEAHINDTTPMYDLTKRNLSLADLLTWRKPSSKVYLTVEL